MTEAMRALGEIEAALKAFVKEVEARHWIHPANIDSLIGGSALTNADLVRAYDALSLLPTLRAALTPPADDEVEAIRGRHDAALARMADNNWPMSEGRQDIAALLAIVDKMRADQ